MRTIISGALSSSKRFETVVAVDHAAIQIIQVGSREAAAIQRHQRPQFGRQYRQHFHHHPIRFDAGLVERFQHFQALGELLDFGIRRGCSQIRAQLLDFVLEIDRAQQLAYALGAHDSGEIIAEFLDLGEVVVLRQQLAARERRHAGVGHDISLEIQHSLDVAQRHVEHHAEPRRQRFQEPDVRDRRRQLDVPHALAPNLGQRHFDAAFLANHAAMLEPLVFAAQAFVVFDRTKNLGAEQPVAFGLKGTIVDGLRLFDFAVRPRADLFRRCKPDFDRVELFFRRYLLEQIQ